MKAKSTFKVYLVNVQTLGAMCGYGEGRTFDEAKQKALVKAKEMDSRAYFSGGMVYFSGGVNC